MSKAQTDIRTTSYDAAHARPFGYQGTIDDVIAQIRAEPEEVRAYWPLNISRERFELLDFLNVHKVSWHFGPWRRQFMAKVEDDSVEYGAPEQPQEPSFYTLDYARKAWPHNFANGES
jgi:hypothetical protein